MNNSDSGPRAAGDTAKPPLGGSSEARPDGMPDAAELSRQMAGIAERSQRLVRDFLARQGDGGEEGVGMANPMAIGAAFFEMTARMMSDPARLVEAQVSLWNDYLRLWQQTTQRFLGGARPSRWPRRRPTTAASATRRGATTRCSTSSSRAIC